MVNRPELVVGVKCGPYPSFPYDHGSRLASKKKLQDGGYDWSVAKATSTSNRMVTSFGKPTPFEGLLDVVNIWLIDGFLHKSHHAFCRKHWQMVRRDSSSPTPMACLKAKRPGQGSYNEA